MTHTHVFIVPRLIDLSVAAEQIVALFSAPQIITFDAPMGAGKTTLVKALCTELGVVDLVSSPTFAIVNEYQTANEQMVFHFDLYRIKDARELSDIGFEEYLDSGNWCMIEWPELAQNSLPEQVVRINIEVDQKEARKITVVW
jgi:tRNA threonylcarbamoyladenosine biosynthesis protein TsaE